MRHSETCHSRLSERYSRVGKEVRRSICPTCSLCCSVRLQSCFLRAQRFHGSRILGPFPFSYWRLMRAIGFVANAIRGFRGIHALVLGAVGSALALLVLRDWFIPLEPSPKLWNGLVGFAILAVVCDTSFLRISFANLGSSIAFIPFLAAVLLFPHPWPMLISGLTAAVVDTLVRRKEGIKVAFNTAQYMLAVGLGQLAYVWLGGGSSLDRLAFGFIPFLGLVTTYVLVNSGSVSLAVSISSGTPLREAWHRIIIGGSFVYDLFSSSLAVLLALVYVKWQILGMALLVLPMFFIRHIYQMNNQLERVNRELLELMVKAIEARDPYTSGHSVRVAAYAKAIARELGLPTRQVDGVETAALMHDVGKIYEEFAPLLRKAGRLTPEEHVVMRAHPVRSAELVSTAADFRGVVQAAVRNHHENYDGSGYPDGLSGEDIPIGARIILIADTLDAMTTDRPYRQALSLDKALQELTKYSGIQFDPKLVHVVMRSASIRRLMGLHLALDGGLNSAVQRPKLDLTRYKQGFAT